MTQVVYVRHGEVENPHDVVYGRLPGFGLSDRGRRQMRATARRIAAMNPKALFASPMLRAVESAEIIQSACAGVSLAAIDELAEVRHSWEGERRNLLPAHYNYYEPKRRWCDEGLDDLHRRMYGFLRYLARKFGRDETVVCVSHCDPIRALCMGIAGEQMSLHVLRRMGDYYPALASLTTVALEMGTSVSKSEVTYWELEGSVEGVRSVQEG